MLNSSLWMTALGQTQRQLSIVSRAPIPALSSSDLPTGSGSLERPILVSKRHLAIR